MKKAYEAPSVELFKFSALENYCVDNVLSSEVPGVDEEGTEGIL